MLAPELSGQLEDELCSVIACWYDDWKESIADFDNKTHNLAEAAQQLEEKLSNATRNFLVSVKAECPD